MSEHILTAVRFAPARDGSHQHVCELFTQGAIRYTLAEVIADLQAGGIWRTVGDQPARLRAIERCPAVGCELAPYVELDGAPGALERLAL